MATEITSVRCLCGKVELEAQGIPILTTVCHCDGCREAADELEELPGAEPVKNADGGVPYVVYRKDRVTCLKGAEHLREHRLKPDSPTRRVVTTCCNSLLHADPQSTFYKRADAPRHSLDILFCPDCGCVIAWRGLALEEDGRRRIAVNVRLTEPNPIVDLPIDHFDGLESFDDLPRDGRTLKDMWF